jgi:Glyoxalase/Bleomycin resistance protein/Dioxygenase superfamily
MSSLAFHHVGCVVESIPDAIEGYRLLARSLGEIIHVSTQGVNVCFVEIAPQSYIELVEPVRGNSMITRLVKKHTTYYHLAFLTTNFEQAIESLTADGYHHLSTFCSEAFQMRRCAFLANSVAHLIEIIETA